MTLAEQIRAIARKHAVSAAGPLADHDDAPRIPTGWPAVDAVLSGGLVRGGLHEWLGVAAAASTRDAERRECWSPPLLLLIHLAWQVQNHTPSPRWAVWIGERCFPYPHVLVRSADEDRALLERSLFVGAHDMAARLWAVDLALRSPVVGLVVADGSGFTMTASRRVQLLARTRRKLALCVRPVGERGMLSAAQSRWLVQRVASPSHVFAPRWNVELLRCKGVQPRWDRPVWALEWDHATGALCLSSTLADSARPTQTGARTRWA